MPRNNPYLTAWNKNIHNGVAACLLDNWVEERAIGEIEGPDAVLTIQNGKPQHRKNRVIFQHDQVDPKKEFVSTTSACFQMPKAGTRDEQAYPQKSYSPRKTTYGGPSAIQGTRRSLVEMQLWEKAKQETTVIEEEPSAKDWQSSYHNSFHKEFDSQDDSLFQDEELMNALNSPMTIYKDLRSHKRLYISSLRRDATIDDKTSGGHFGRNVDFSTPTENYLKGPEQIN